MKLRTLQISWITGLVLAAFLNTAAAESQNDQATVGDGTNTYIGTYHAFAKMTNSAGSFWLTPPANTHTGTFTNACGFTAPFASALLVTRKSDGQIWFTNTASLPFTATNSSYSLTLFITSTLPPPTNSQPLNLQVVWQ